MRGINLRLMGMAVLLSLIPPAVAQETKPPAAPPVAQEASTDVTNRVVFYSAWDDDYLYLIVQVNKPTVTGKNGKAFSNPLEDDALLLTLQTDNTHKETKRTAKTFTLAVSAVGGTQLYIGEASTPIYKGLEEDFQKRFDAVLKEEKDPATQQAKLDALLRSLIKVGVSPQGAKRPIGTPAAGYTAEFAIPWLDLGVKPQADMHLGFNLAAQSISPGSPPLQSFSSRIKQASDLDNPSLLGEIVLATDPAPLKGTLYTSPRVFGNKPLIDGELGANEWNTLSMVSFGENLGAVTNITKSSATVAARVRPAYVPRPVRPSVALPTAPVEPITLPAHQPQSVTPLVFGVYDFAYQGDPRKAIPTQGVTNSSGGTLTATHPVNGSGAWFSYDRADWHRTHLLEARSSGIDVVLPLYKADPRSMELHSRKGLHAMVAALEYMRGQGQDYPLIGLYLDTTSLTEILGANIDLRERTAQAALYGVIRDFYRAIPEPCRCVVPLSVQNGGRKAIPVFLSSSAPFKEIDSQFLAYLRGRFANDFAGADLLILGNADFKGKANLDGYFQNTREKGVQFEVGGWISIASVGAGYDNSLTRATGEPLLVRASKGGETYRANWKEALGRKPNWVLLDGWNDYAHGAALTPTLEEGLTHSDLTRLYTRFFAGDARLAMKFLTHDAPSAMVAGHNYSVNARIQNTGIVSWGNNNDSTTAQVSFSYRWKRGGEVVAQGSASLLHDIFPARASDSINLLVQTLDNSKQPLPEGDYTLEVGATAPDKATRKPVWVGDTEPTRALQVPVHIYGATNPNAPQWAATLIYANLPRTVESGGIYDFQALVRNDGSTTWRASEGARITLRLYRTEAKGGTALGTLTETPVTIPDATALIEKDVAPGQEVTVKLTLPVMDTAGQPLPLWSQEQDWYYTLRFEMSADKVPIPTNTNTTAPLNQVGTLFAPTPLAIVDYDFGVKFILDATPPSLPAERRLPVRLGLQNTGSQIWKAENVRIGYHWYYKDGTELVFEDETTPLPQDLAPGKSLKDVLAYVTAPPLNGEYWLVWDVKVGDTWASTTSSVRVLDESLRPVRVLGNKLAFADLSKHYNIDGISDTGTASDGNIDGQGHSFPAEAFPPFMELNPAPATLGLSAVRKGPESPRRIGFRFGSKEPKAKNFIACTGQRIDLGSSAAICRVLHILATSTGKSTGMTLGLVFEENNGTSEDQYAFSVSRWDKPSLKNEEIAFQSRWLNGKQGVEETTASLYHYTIKIRDPRKLIAITLPNSPDVKIAALTLEK